MKAERLKPPVRDKLRTECGAFGRASMLAKARAMAGSRRVANRSGDTEICKTHPGFDEDLYVTAEAEAFIKWHAGQLTWADATRSRRIQLHGLSWIVRAFPTWNARSAFAHIKPVARIAASSATMKIRRLSRAFHGT